MNTGKRIFRVQAMMEAGCYVGDNRVFAYAIIPE